MKEINGACVYEDADIKQFYPPRPRNSHKGTYGTANICAGSEKYMGAAALSAEGALRSGCGYVKLTTCNAVKNALVAAYPQVIYLDEPDLKAQAIAIGMGGGRTEELYKCVCRLIKNYTGKLIIDADAINVLADFGKDILKSAACDILITPHVREFSRISGMDESEIIASPISCAQQFAKEHKITVLLKNAVSAITDGDRAVLNERGSTALAKGGSGDILSGLIAGTAARGLNLFDAAICSAYTLGAAAEECSRLYTDYCATANDLLKILPKTVKRLTS